MSRGDVPRLIKRMREIAAQPGVMQLSEEARLKLAIDELGLVAVDCPRCDGSGCQLCEYEGTLIVSTLDGEVGLE